MCQSTPIQSSQMDTATVQNRTSAAHLANRLDQFQIHLNLKTARLALPPLHLSIQVVTSSVVLHPRLLTPNYHTPKAAVNWSTGRWSCNGQGVGEFQPNGPSQSGYLLLGSGHYPIDGIIRWQAEKPAGNERGEHCFARGLVQQAARKIQLQEHRISVTGQTNPGL